jgi:hypothetical protein
MPWYSKTLKHVITQTTVGTKFRCLRLVQICSVRKSVEMGLRGLFRLPLVAVLEHRFRAVAIKPSFCLGIIA